MIFRPELPMAVRVMPSVDPVALMAGRNANVEVRIQVPDALVDVLVDYRLRHRFW